MTSRPENRCIRCGLIFKSPRQVNDHKCFGVLKDPPLIGNNANADPSADLNQLPPERQQLVDSNSSSEQNEEEFDADFDFLRIVTHAGLSTQHITALIQLMQRCKEHKQEVTFTSASAVIKKREEVLVQNDMGWNTQSIVVSDTDTFTFHHRDVLQVLTEICSTSDLKQNFCVSMKPKYADAECSQRVYDEPINCDAAIRAQCHVRELGGHNASVLLLQLYSDKTVLNMKGTSCHPVRLAVLNVPYAHRHKATDIIGYFPVMPGVDRSVKLETLKQCLELLLSPLEEPSKKGHVMEVPDGSRHLLFPRILSYVADDPEIRDVLCILNHNGKYPCERCKVNNKELFSILETVRPRTSRETKQVVESALHEVAKGRKKMTNVKSELAEQHSLSPLLSGLFIMHGDYGLNGDSNFHFIFGHDTLHNDDLGLIPDMVTAICNWIKEEWPGKGHKHVYAKFNRMLAKIKRYTKLKLPTNNYFPNSPHAQAIEHRSVLQVLPHMLAALQPVLEGEKNAEKKALVQQQLRGITEAAAAFALCYAACHRKNTRPYYTTADLENKPDDTNTLIGLIKHANDLFMEYLASYLPSKGNTIKRHRHLNHFLDAIKELGHPRNYSSQHFESAHKYDKRAYKLSGRTPGKVEHGIIRQRKLAFLQLPDMETTSKQSAQSVSRSTGDHCLVENGVKIELICLEEGAECATLTETVKLLLETRSELKKIPAHLKEYARKFLRQGSSSPDVSSSITVVKSAVLAAKEVPGAEKSLVQQTLRASEQYYGKRAFDLCFARCHRQRGANSREGVMRLCRVRAFFHCEINKQRMQFALVEELEENPTMQSGAADAQGEIASHGCTRWNVTAKYQVVALQDIKRRVDALPPLEGNHAEDRFTISTYMWYDTSKAFDIPGNSVPADTSEPAEGPPNKRLRSN